MEILRDIATNYQTVFYLFTVLFFIFGLKLLTSAKTARKGNWLSAFGMSIAVIATLLYKGIVSYEIIIIVMVIASIVGIVSAYVVDMRAIPQFVAVLNSFGGGVSALVAIVEFLKGKLPPNVEKLPFDEVTKSMYFHSAVAIDMFVGTITFWGSLVAFAKLQKIITERPIVLPAKNLVNFILLVGIIILGVLLVINPENLVYMFGILLLSSFLGLSLTLAVGGADMPVVISLFISYAGLSAGTLGFVFLNHGLIMVGALVGASGLILTRIMAKSMNRDFYGILLGNITPPEMSKVQDDKSFYQGKIKSTTPDEVAMILENASTISIVPGYGLAVAQAQGAVRDLYNELTKDGKEVYFAIHPVAGRMPGHMNVLLAEVDIPYDKLKTLEESNELLPDTDVAIVVGANDVVNPMARDAKDTPIYGMPILDVDKAKTVIVIKRSLAPGFAGIPNPLFINENTLMLFADAKPGLSEIVREYKELKS
ncbi:MAG: NAD(P)(+) transhydrogenase (Re/Si-specific) subunit beta [Brevinematia bacterium]